MSEPRPHRTFRLPKGVVAAVLILLIVEVAMARQDWLWALEPRSSSGIVDVLEDQVISVSPPVEVVFFGSSRVRDAVVPREMEQGLGLPIGSVLNLGLTEGSIFDSLTLYERNREKLSGARLVVVGVEIDDFVAEPLVNNRLRRFASWEDRLSWPGPERVSLLIGGVWRTYDGRENLRGLISSVWRREPPDPPISEDGRVVWREPVEDGPSQIDGAEAAHSLYDGEQPGEGYVDSLRRLIALIEEDGAEVAIIHVPVRDGVADALEREFGRLVENMRTSVADVKDQSLVDIVLRRSSVPGLEPIDFVDYGHLTADGGLVTTDYYIDLFRGSFPTLWS